MKLTILCAVSVAFAIPSSGYGELSKRQDVSAVTMTDKYLFDTSLSDFGARREAKDPSNLIWDADGCDMSPDNPLGFPFLPACERHDFGYRNYKAQDRFTADGRSKIDDKFKADLYEQCSKCGWCSASAVKSICTSLADTYYSAVRAFGDKGVKTRDEAAVKEYEEKLAIYNAALERARKDGLIPITMVN
ncbi:hypothetical protein QQS21_000080 [Conoideocrella luteorostrata]|uniref:Secretory phospholipase A2 n=1 Tax=Conoideocrella luteorostrata TaxID=1105319 RepID=A0AAJ0D1G5_9HYPO|nr:hypothetical protein QQS21_000080 [Conoideocrella luteorostrata]